MKFLDLSPDCIRLLAGRLSPVAVIQLCSTSAELREIINPVIRDITINISDPTSDFDFDHINADDTNADDTNVDDTNADDTNADDINDPDDPDADGSNDLTTNDSEIKYTILFDVVYGTTDIPDVKYGRIIVSEPHIDDYVWLFNKSKQINIETQKVPNVCIRNKITTETLIITQGLQPVSQLNIVADEVQILAIMVKDTPIDYIIAVYIAIQPEVLLLSIHADNRELRKAFVKELKEMIRKNIPIGKVLEVNIETVSSPFVLASTINFLMISSGMSVLAYST
jgi:hypothetical protein